MKAERRCGDQAYLEEMLTGSPPPEELDELAEHLEACEACRALSDRIASGQRSWRGLLGLAGRPRAEGPPTDDFPGADDPAFDFDYLRPSPDASRLGFLGPYEVIEVLGRGGMGVVFKAWDTTLDRSVALKVLSPRDVGRGPSRLRFAREARAAAAVVHDHVVTIHSVSESGEVPYLVMEYVPGESLQDRIDREGGLPVGEIARIGHQAASGLAAAHARGIVHRDIKPANILLGEDGRARIADFGLARGVDNVSLTNTGVVAGTPLYMAPEQAMGGPVDARSDLFSLGAVLYSMCVGSSPFQGDSTMAVLRRICDEDPRPAGEARPDIPGWLEDVVAKLLEKDPSGRYQSALELAEVLAGHLGEPDRGGPSVSARPASAAPSGAGKKWAAIVVAAALATASAAWMVAPASSRKDRAGTGRPAPGGPPPARRIVAAGPISGRVVEPATGRPVPGASVEFHPRLEVDGRARDVRIARDVSGPDGSFRVAGTAGPGFLVVNAPGGDFVAREFGGNLEVDGRVGGMRCYAHALLPLDDVPEAGLGGVELAPRRGVTVRGRVEGPGGRPVAVAKVISRSNATGEHPALQSFASPVVDGRFELPGCAPGEAYEAFVADPADGWGGVATIRAAGDEAPEAVVRLAPACSAVVRFQDASGGPIIGCDTVASIVLSPGIDHLESLQPDRRDELASQEVALDKFAGPAGPTDGSGRVSLRGLIPGANYRVVLLMHGRIAASVGFAAGPDRAADLVGVVQARPVAPKREPGPLPLLGRD
jgi:hypothetical protein